MSMDKVIKINSKQGTFDAGTGATKRLCDFHVSGGEVYNFKESYININLQVETTDTNENPDANPPVAHSGGRGVQLVDLGIQDNTIGNSNTLLPNVCLVKNMNLRSQNLGRLDDIRRLDHLNHIKYNYEKDTNDKIDASYYSLSGAKQDTQWRNSPFQRLEKDGSNVSVNKPHNVRIGLGEISDLFNEEMVDCNRLGSLDLHLELNLDKLRVHQQLGGSVQATPQPEDRDFVWFETPEGYVGNNNVFSPSPVSTVANTPVNSLITVNKFSPNDFKTRSPFWTGQKLTFSGFKGVSGATNVFPATERIISSLNYDNTTGFITLNLDAPLTLLPVGELVEDIICVGTNFATSKIVVNKIEMVLKVVNNPVNVPTQLSYYTYKTEEDNLNNRVNVNKNYQVQGDAQNLYIGFGGDVVNTLGATSIENYRIQLNNDDLVNRDIDMNGSIHDDLVNKTYLNNQRVLKNLTHNMIDITKTNDENLTFSHSILTPLTQRTDLEQSILGLEFNTTGGGNGINDIKIYQEVLKTI